jgi:hypothetical protein
MCAGGPDGDVDAGRCHAGRDRHDCVAWAGSVRTPVTLHQGSIAHAEDLASRIRHQTATGSGCARRCREPTRRLSGRHRQVSAPGGTTGRATAGSNEKRDRVPRSFRWLPEEGRLSAVGSGSPACRGGISREGSLCGSAVHRIFSRACPQVEVLHGFVIAASVVLVQSRG